MVDPTATGVAAVVTVDPDTDTTSCIATRLNVFVCSGVAETRAKAPGKLAVCALPTISTSQSSTASVAVVAEKVTTIDPAKLAAWCSDMRTLLDTLHTVRPTKLVFVTPADSVTSPVPVFTAEIALTSTVEIPGVVGPKNSTLPGVQPVALVTKKLELVFVADISVTFVFCAPANLKSVAAEPIVIPYLPDAIDALSLSTRSCV